MFCACPSARAEGLCRSLLCGKASEPRKGRQKQLQVQVAPRKACSGPTVSKGSTELRVREGPRTPWCYSTINVFGIVFVLTVYHLLFEYFWSAVTRCCLGSCHLSSCPTSEATCRAPDKCTDHSHKSALSPQKVLQASSTLLSSWHRGRNNLWVRP